MILFQWQYQILCPAMGFSHQFSSVNFGVLAMWSSWSVLAVIFCISKELWSSTRIWSHSVPMLLWSYHNMSWWLLLILFSWASIQRLPWLSLQETHTLFWYFLLAVCTDTLSVAEHETQSLEAVSMSESFTFSLDDSESKEVWSTVLFELLATVPSSSLMVALVGLEGGLTGSCPHGSKLVPVVGINLGMSSLQNCVHS